MYLDLKRTILEITPRQKLDTRNLRPTLDENLILLAKSALIIALEICQKFGSFIGP